MARRGTKNELVKCEYCGEMYSVTYKHCPFCNEDGTGRWDDMDGEEYYDDSPRGGKRLMGGSRGNGPSVGRIVWTVISLALIIAAVCIVISLVRTWLGKKDPNPAQSTAPSTAPTVSASVAPAASAPAASEPAVVSVPPAAPSASASLPPQPTVTTPSVDLVTPTSFSLNREDFTFDAPGQVFQMRVSYVPANARAEVVWKSSNPNVASVSWNGMVTAVSKGTVTLTATVEGVGEKTCIVRCSFKDGTAAASSTPAPAASSAPASSSGLSLNREDFTLSHEGETWRLKVSGTSSAVTWSTSDSSVATVGGDGTVTAVGKGTCKVSATVDGVTLKCIVRCSF